MVAVNLAGTSTVSIYPNPAQNQVSISIVNPSTEIAINIYNAIGQKVFSKVYAGNENHADQSISIPTAGNFPAGIYTVSAETNGNEINEKLVVQ